MTAALGAEERVMGDVEAEFTAYVRSRQEHLLRVAVLMCGDVHAAEDLLQDALVKLARHWQRVQDGNPDSYVRRILYNDTITRWRKRRFEVVSDSPPEVAGIDFGDAWASGDALRGALQQLPARQRAVLVLRYFEDLTEAQTARVMETSVGTVKSQHSAGVAKLRDILGQTWGLGQNDEKGAGR